MSEKTIDTLVDDIYHLLDNGKSKPNQEFLFGMAAAIMDSVRKQLWFSSQTDKRPALRMSNIGKPCSRALWYEITAKVEGEPYTPQTRLKFMFGDIAEALILYLAKEAGHSVEDQQKEIEIDGIKGHLDAVIDGELVDVKSASAYGMRKFKEATLPNDDPFGYISQISGYANALGKSSGTFLAFDKSSGELATYTHHDLENTSERIASVSADMARTEPPDRAFETVLDRKDKRQKLGINCSYCSYKETCWADEGMELKFRSGRPVFFIGEAPETDEEDYGTF